MGDGTDASRAGETTAVFEAAAPGEPLTSREVADELGVARTTAYKKLRRLAEDGLLRTKKVGARGRVWWLPPERSPPADDHRVANARLFRAIFEEAFDAMLIADDEARYVDVNPAACELFGLPREDLLGRTIAEFAAEEYDFEEAWKDFQAAGLDRGLFPLYDADGEHRIVEFNATPNILPGRHLSVIRDVTERQEAKTELERERERTELYQKSLTADTAIELSIRLDEDALFGDVPGAPGYHSTFEGTVSASDDRLLHYVTVAGVPAEDVSTMVAAAAAVTDHRVVFADETSTLVELVVERSPVRTLLEAGASCRSMESECDETTLVAEVGADVDLQGLVAAVRTAYPGAEVVAKRTLERPILTTRQYREAIRDSLTERQMEVLRAAYLAGYFEWPRISQAGVIASTMGIATSTWLRHLRLAEAAIVDWFFEELEV